MTEQFEGLSIKLYPHQIKGVELISDYEYNRRIVIDDVKYNELQQYSNIIIGSNLMLSSGDIIDTKIGIYGDITGYGKTITMLAYLTKYYHQKRSDSQYLKLYQTSETVDQIKPSSEFVKHRGKRQVNFQMLPQTLILVNKQIAKQWDNELSKTDLKYLTISMQKHIPIDLDTLQTYEVIVCTDTMSKYFYYKYWQYTWRRIVIDEPTENLVPYDYKSDFYWLISASYHDIPVMSRQKNIYRMIFPPYDKHVYIHAFLVRNDPDFVKASYQLPVIDTIVHQCYEHSLAQLVKPYISAEIASMISAGNIKEAIIRLGGTTPDASILELVNKKKKEELLECQFKYDKYHQKYIVEKNRDYKNNYEKWQERRTKLMQEINEIDNKYKESLNQGCAICYDDFENNKVILLPCCQNLVCGICLFNWFEKQSTCPYCRSLIERKNIIYLEKSVKIKPELVETEQNSHVDKIKRPHLKLSAKKETRLEKIINLIKTSPSRKFIVVSMYDETFNHIKKQLEDNDISYTEIKGQKSHIDKEIQRVYNGLHRVVFLNGQYQGTGLNLQLMTDIILYHDMDCSIITQVMGRINRIGSNEIRGSIQPRLHKFIVNHI